MSRSSQLSPENLLRFLQVKSEPASANDIARGLHLGKSDRRPLFKILTKLKKRNAIEELPGGRYRLAKRDQAPAQEKTRRAASRDNPAPPEETNREFRCPIFWRATKSRAAWYCIMTATASSFPPPRSRNSMAIFSFRPAA